MKIRNVAVAAIVLGLGMAWSRSNWAQDSPQSQRDVLESNLWAMQKGVEAQEAAAKEVAKAAAVQAKIAASHGEIQIRKIMPAAFGLPRHLTEIQEAAERYAHGKDDKQKEDALHQLRDLASKYFEEDMAVRKKELADIEARLEKLRAQLERRRAKKDEIVDLQVRVAINEAEGLGFTSAPRDNFNFDVRVSNPLYVPADGPKVGWANEVPPPGDAILPLPPVKVATPAPATRLSIDPLALGVGAKGEAVRLLQRTLNESGDPSPNLNVDGDFGPETEKAVKAFQAKHELDETGVVDEATRKELDLPAELPPFIKN